MAALAAETLPLMYKPISGLISAVFKMDLAAVEG
jgi:hypothetical protein